MLETAIIGGGLCGLALANSLQAEGREFMLFEARARLGGRILSAPVGDSELMADLGAAWYWPASQPRITQLVKALDLASFSQWDSGKVLKQTDGLAKPETMDIDAVHGGARRLAGGMGRLVTALAERLPQAVLNLGHELTAVADRGAYVELRFRRGGQSVIVNARRVVLAIPPRLLDQRVRFEPGLDARVRQAMRDTPTWMAGQAKAVAAYGRPFWREEGLSGSAFASHSQAVLGETYDASDVSGEPGGLGGFLALSPMLRQQFREGLPMLITSQLTQCFGPTAALGEPLYQDWAEEPYTCSTLDRDLSSAHPAYGHTYLKLAHWQDKLYFGGTETAAYGGGYMEGALEAAGRIRREIIMDFGMAA